MKIKLGHIPQHLILVGKIRCSAFTFFHNLSALQSTEMCTITIL